VEKILVWRVMENEFFAQARELKESGNAKFRMAQYEEALNDYREALQCLDEPIANEQETEKESKDEIEEGKEKIDETMNELRVQLHGNSAAVLLKMQMYEDAESECTAALKLDSDYTKALLRRATAAEAQVKPGAALADYERVIKLEQEHNEEQTAAWRVASAGRARVAQAAQEEAERERAELMGKMKGMADKVLGFFGMSTDDFQMTQDPESGGYSISTKQS
jgi:tetratricopeptide repeat protein 1